MTTFWTQRAQALDLASSLLTPICSIDEPSPTCWFCMDGLMCAVGLVTHHPERAQATHTLAPAPRQSGITPTIALPRLKSTITGQPYVTQAIDNQLQTAAKYCLPTHVRSSPILHYQTTHAMTGTRRHPPKRSPEPQALQGQLAHLTRDRRTKLQFASGHRSRDMLHRNSPQQGPGTIAEASLKTRVFTSRYCTAAA